MLQKRPIVVADGVVLGGNMRFLAAKAIGLKEVPVIDASEWTQEQRDEFIIKDNVSFGEWNWDDLANEWEPVTLGEWGLDAWVAPDLDYSVLEDEKVEDELGNFTEGVRKAIMIEFTMENYAIASELIKFWRERSGDVGLMLIEKLREEKNNL